MKKVKYALLTILITAHLILSGQIHDDILSRLHGITYQGNDFYNVDGYEISNIKMQGAFTIKGIIKTYRKYKLTKEELIVSDSTIPLPNYVVHRSERVLEDIIYHSSHYFIKSNENEITAITFDSYNEPDSGFQSNLVSLIINKEIPESVFSPMQPVSINFGGRSLDLGGNCRWMNVNNIQCSGYGQMNWSVCQSERIANDVIATHRKVMESKNNGKVFSEEIVDLKFEGVDTKATRLVWDFTGVTSALVGMSGGKMLTIYFVTAPVRGNYISCVLSFWNNDVINPGGLPPLLEQVLELK